MWAVAYPNSRSALQRESFGTAGIFRVFARRPRGTRPQDPEQHATSSSCPRASHRHAQRSGSGRQARTSKMQLTSAASVLAPGGLSRPVSTRGGLSRLATPRVRRAKRTSERRARAALEALGDAGAISAVTHGAQQLWDTAVGVGLPCTVMLFYAPSASVCGSDCRGWRLRVAPAPVREGVMCALFRLSHSRASLAANRCSNAAM